MITFTDPGVVGTLAVLSPLGVLLAGMLLAHILERGPIDGCDE